MPPTALLNTFEPVCARMKAAQQTTPAMAGPLRWGYRQYALIERRSPGGRRFEVRSPKDELVLLCRIRNRDDEMVFFADEKGTQELFRMEAKTVRLFDRAFDVIDPVSKKPFAEIRKKYYKPLRKSEWFIHDPDGELVGMVTETAPESSLLRRLIPVDRLFPKAWALHWGQAIGGIIQPRMGFINERLDINLGLDTKDEIDRRVAIAVTVALRADEAKGET